MRVKKLFLPIALIVSLLMSVVPAAHPASASANGLVAQYKLDGDFKDSSGNGNDGILVGDVSFTDDSVMGKCAVFNGGYVNVKNSQDLNLGSNFTVSVWLMVDPSMAIPNNKSGPIISKLNDRGIYNNYILYTRGTFGIRADLYTDQGGKNITNKAFTDYKLNNWSQLVFSGDGQNLYLYHNGVLVSTQPVGSGVSIASSTGDMRIGNGNDLNSKNLFFKGRMADLRIYNRALSSSEVSTLYSSGAAMKPQTPTVDRGTGSTGSITVLLNNQPLKLEVPPQVENGRTLVPLRAIFEGLGANVQWNQADQSITATKGSQVLTLVVGSDTALNNGSPVSLDVPPMIVGGRTLVPLRFVSENMGAQVGWDGGARQVSIVSSGVSSLPAASGIKLSPAKIDGVIGNAHKQFCQLTQVNKLSSADALSQQIASLRQQPDIDLVEQLQDSSNLRVRFKDGYELVMLQGYENVGGGEPLTTANLDSSTLVNKPPVLPEIITRPVELPDVNPLLTHGQQTTLPAASTVAHQNPNVGPKVVFDRGKIEIDPALLMPHNPTPISETVTLFNACADDPRQMYGFDDKIKDQLVDAGYTVYKIEADSANLKYLSNLANFADGIVFICSHGAVVDNDFYFMTRPYYTSAPPADSGYTGTIVFSVYINSWGDVRYVYAVGSDFAKKYWTKPFPGTVFIMLSCSSAKAGGTPGLPTWVQDHGASAWIGWTDDVSFRNGDQGTVKLFEQLNQWKTFNAAMTEVNNTLYSRPPDLTLVQSAWSDGDRKLTHFVWDKKESDVPDGRDFYSAKLDISGMWLDAKVNFCGNYASSLFYMYLDPDGDGKEEWMVRCTPTIYEVSYMGSSDWVLFCKGIPTISGKQYQMYVPYAPSVNKIRLVDESAAPYDSMPDVGWW